MVLTFPICPSETVLPQEQRGRGWERPGVCWEALLLVVGSRHSLLSATPQATRRTRDLWGAGLRIFQCSASTLSAPLSLCSVCVLEHHLRDIRGFPSLVYPCGGHTGEPLFYTDRSKWVKF